MSKHSSLFKVRKKHILDGWHQTVQGLDSNGWLWKCSLKGCETKKTSRQNATWLHAVFKHKSRNVTQALIPLIFFNAESVLFYHQALVIHLVYSINYSRHCYWFQLQNEPCTARVSHPRVRRQTPSPLHLWAFNSPCLETETGFNTRQTGLYLPADQWNVSIK